MEKPREWRIYYWEDVSDKPFTEPIKRVMFTHAATEADVRLWFQESYPVDEIISVTPAT